MSQLDLAKVQPTPRTSLQTGTENCRECRMGAAQAAQVNVAFFCPTHGTRVVEVVPASLLYVAQREIEALRGQISDRSEIERLKAALARFMVLYSGLNRLPIDLRKWAVVTDNRNYDETIAMTRTAVNLPTPEEEHHEQH